MTGYLLTRYLYYRDGRAFVSLLFRLDGGSGHVILNEYIYVNYKIWYTIFTIVGALKGDDRSRLACWSYVR